MSGKQFLVVSCFSCGMFQVIQENQKLKFKCKVCQAPQSLRRVHASSTQAKDLRPIVQSLNLKKGELGLMPTPSSDEVAEKADDEGGQTRKKRPSRQSIDDADTDAPKRGRSASPCRDHVQIPSLLIRNPEGEFEDAPQPPKTSLRYSRLSQRRQPPQNPRSPSPDPADDSPRGQVDRADKEAEIDDEESAQPPVRPPLTSSPHSFASPPARRFQPPSSPRGGGQWAEFSDLASSEQ
ncbi:hypothetical protein PAPYR_5984 [Paratrimastix pyriformis]|uniref:MRN complex-interacting protein N-terminal domain-containing protein n=1 Tax=Paratrimastix pyriformis TaxID=342808 RepID=A0ABQ8UGB5_9EUKA|nr:hypothetical protein PAPYR_5984 [Paratrimastix pyriformis]